jgi:hypothetical protein
MSLTREGICEDLDAFTLTLIDYGFIKPGIDLRFISDGIYVVTFDKHEEEVQATFAVRVDAVDDKLAMSYRFKVFEWQDGNRPFYHVYEPIDTGNVQMLSQQLKIAIECIIEDYENALAERSKAWELDDE